MRSARNLWASAAVLVALILGACSSSPKAPIYYDTAGWPPTMESIALVELSFERRYRPPPGIDLSDELRRALRQELARKGYRMLVADRGAEIYGGETSTAQLAARAPKESDALLALHIDFLFLSATFSERNPPPEAEISAEARLISRQGQELWRDRGNGQGGGTIGLPVVYAETMRYEALAELARELFATLPNSR